MGFIESLYRTGQIQQVYALVEIENDLIAMLHTSKIMKTRVISIPYLRLMQKLHLLLLLLTMPAALVSAQTYTSCPDCWNADSLGNHRAVVRFDGPGTTAHAYIPWRLPLAGVFNHRIIVQDAKTGARIDAASGALTRESGDIFFPAVAKGRYYVYYLPYKNEGKSNYPKGIYLRPDTSAAFIATTAPRNCTVAGFESIDSFNTFYPMQVIATAGETAALKARYAGRSYLVFPEDAKHPIAMQHDLPQRWIQKGFGNKLSIYTMLGDYCPFQVGVYAMTSLEDVRLTFSDLKDDLGHMIPANYISCINTTGVSYDGKPFTKVVNIPAGQVQALWCGVDTRDNSYDGDFAGTVTIAAKNVPPTTIHILLTIGQDMPYAAYTPNMDHLQWLQLDTRAPRTIPSSPLTRRSPSTATPSSASWAEISALTNKVSPHRSAPTSPRR